MKSPMHAQGDSWQLTTTSASPATRGLPELPESATPRVSLSIVSNAIEETAPKDYGSVSDLVTNADRDATRRVALAQARMELANDQIIANTLSALRLKLGLSQADLAAICETSQSHIARVEAGEDIRMSTLLKLSSALRVSPSVALEAALTKLASRE